MAWPKKHGRLLHAVQSFDAVLVDQQLASSTSPSLSRFHHSGSLRHLRFAGRHLQAPHRKQDASMSSESSSSLYSWHLSSCPLSWSPKFGL